MKFMVLVSMICLAVVAFAATHFKNDTPMLPSNDPGYMWCENAASTGRHSVYEPLLDSQQLDLHAAASILSAVYALPTDEQDKHTYDLQLADYRERAGCQTLGYTI